MRSRIGTKAHPCRRSEKLLRIGAPERIRTSDPVIRSHVLYPAELRARAVTVAGVEPAFVGAFRKHYLRKRAIATDSGPALQAPNATFHVIRKLPEIPAK